MDLVDIAQPSERAYRRGHAPIVIAVLAAVVGLSALDVAPIVILALIGVAMVLVTRCIDADEAFGFIEGRLLAMIFGDAGGGAGLDHSGAVQADRGCDCAFYAGLAAVYVWSSRSMALTSVLTEMVSEQRGCGDLDADCDWAWHIAWG